MSFIQSVAQTGCLFTGSGLQIIFHMSKTALNFINLGFNVFINRSVESLIGQAVIIKPNRIRPRGVVEKCTFCLQRTRQGMLPACAEVCPTGSRVFANILEPGNPITYILENKRVYIFKEDLKTIPRFYYFFDK